MKHFWHNGHGCNFCAYHVTALSYSESLEKECASHTTEMDYFYNMNLTKYSPVLLGKLRRAEELFYLILIVDVCGVAARRTWKRFLVPLSNFHGTKWIPCFYLVSSSYIQEINTILNSKRSQSIQM